jgi:hypothetical protein
VAVVCDGDQASLLIDDHRPVRKRIPRGRTDLGGGRLVVGCAHNGDSPFDGEIDELRIWSVARSSLEIRRNRDREIESVRTLTGYWRFDDGGTDLSTGGNPLKVRGAVLFLPGRLGRSAHILNIDPLRGELASPGDPQPALVEGSRGITASRPPR